MRIHIIAVGERMPAWVEQGYQDYARRAGAELNLQLTEITTQKRGKNADVKRIMQKEGERMLQALPGECRVLALERTGHCWSTEELAQQLADWQQGGRDVAILIGGPEGLAPACLQRADLKWSLSKLTFPHPLVRVILAEQLYRAWSILKHHPYHK